MSESPGHGASDLPAGDSRRLAGYAASDPAQLSFGPALMIIRVITSMQ
jgi:hypothetical protein